MSEKLDIWKVNDHEHKGRKPGVRMIGAMRELRSSEALSIYLKSNSEWALVRDSYFPTAALGFAIMDQLV